MSFEQVLDYLFYEIRFEKRVPVRRVSDLNFSDEEERKIEKQVEKLLKTALKLSRRRKFSGDGFPTTRGESMNLSVRNTKL